MGRRFEPELDVIQPTGASREDHIGTVRIHYKGRVVHVLFHDEFYRVRFNEAPMAITEAFLTGKRSGGQHAIIRIDPLSEESA